MRKRLLSILLLCCMVLTLLPTAALAAGDVAIDETNFPDDNFRQYVKDNFDNNKDNSLSAGEIAAVKALDRKQNLGLLKDITGIVFFTELESLVILQNRFVTQLDISENTKLKELLIGGPPLTSLDVSKNTALESLRLPSCQLETLDLSQNTALKELDCRHFKFSTLDLSQHTALENIKLSSGNLHTLDVGKNTVLKKLDVKENPLTSMNLGDSGSTIEVELNNLPYPIEVSRADKTFDLSTLPTGFNVTKASGWTNGTVAGNILTVAENASTVTYIYDCGERQATYGTPAVTERLRMPCTLQVNWVSAPAVTEDDLAGLNIPTNLVTVKCQTTGDSKAYGRIPGGFDLSNATPYMENGVLKAIVKLNLPAYKDKYDADTKKTHENAGPGSTSTPAFTLKYVNDKWELDGTFPNVVILVKCDGQHPQTPPHPTEENVSGLGDQIVAVLCNNVPTGQQSGKYYGLIGGGFTSTAPTLNADKVYESTITLIPSVYCNQFSGDTGIMHKVLSAQTTDGLKFVVKYDSSTKMWKPAEEVKQMAIWVTCDKHETPTPEMPMYPMTDNISGLGDQIVAVLCNNVPTGQQSGKYYGLIGGGFTSTAPTLNADKVYESTITLIPSVYCNQFSGDTGIMHKVLSAQTTDGLKFVVKYDSSTKMWKPAEEVKQMAIWVTCDKHETDTPVPTEFTITFNGNDGTPSVGSMRTTNQKLTSLPTATRSGRYSFDGWYTAASGGTKITTATVFYENTTVYAHWTYIGGGGSSGGGGGYTYHTIRAISGLNGSISPSGWTSVRHGWDQTFTITPDKGYAVAKVLVDGKSVGSVKSYTFKNVTKDHTIEVVFMKANGNPQTGVFVDVPEGSYYEEAVDWAVEKGITTGTGNNYFTPDGICTRAQAVTFLWRVAGSPTPKTEAMVFEDVLDGSYYYEAVLWAVENGITVGTSATTFSPELTCSRAHIVTFLWRAANSPSAKTANPFTDVAADAYYIDAVLWAVKHKITVGTTLSTFGPDEGCTRAQIVTFLYRAHSK